MNLKLIPKAGLFGYSYSGKTQNTRTEAIAFPQNRGSIFSTQHSLGHYEEVLKPPGMR